MIKLFSMFSGYGGAEWALKRAGIPFECVGYSEIKDHAIKCYNLNHVGTKNFGDCTKIDANKLPDFDLLTGGFPCQDVSMAGKRDLEKGRTNLFREIIRIAKEKKPGYMVLENVGGLLSMGKKSYATETYFDIIKKELRNIGYNILYTTLNSKDYGMPHNRKRIWIICKYGNWGFMEFKFPEKEELKISVSNILNNDVNEKYYLNSDQITKMANHAKKFKQGNEILPVSGVCPCLMASFGEYVFELEDKKIRKLTPKECFRLMGFSNDEIKLDNLTDKQAYNLAGDGWDINVVAKIFKNLYGKNGQVQ